MGTVRSGTAPYFREFLDTLSTYAPVGDFRNRIVAFLLDCGITQDTLDSVIAIMRK